MALKPKTIPSTLKPSRDGDYFLITAPNYWGRGATLEDAKREIKRAGPRDILKGRWRVYSVHPETYVNGYGELVHKNGHPPVKLDEHDPA